MATKKTGATTPTTTAATTPATAVEKVKRGLGLQTGLARKELLERSQQMAANAAKVAEVLADETPQGGMTAASSLLQSYWPMRDAAQAAGKVAVYENANAILAKLEAEHAADPDAILAKFLRRMTRLAIDDKYRNESSSNAFSNAFSNAGGEGRGDAYQQIIDIIDCYTDGL
jgi:hypothetical protein